MSTLKTARIFALLLVTLLVTPLAAGCAEQVKEPSVAGQFYPSDKKALGEMVNGFIGNVPQNKGEGKIIALISPHAGYVYSGQVAAYGYRQIQGHEIKNIILLGVSHRSAFKGASVYTKGRFKTPLGEVKINEPLAQSFLNEAAEVKYFPEAFEKEHSLEVQLPFLQTVLKDFMIIPILIGSPTQQTFDHLIARIAETFDENTLIVASTDLSHYHDYHKAIGMDSKIISAVERLSAIRAGQILQNGEAEMCGAFAVIITMEAAKRLGATHGVLFHYANSGDVTGGKDKVVGYASLGLFRSPYTETEKKELLSLAKNAIAEHVTNGKTPDREIANPKLRADGAVFVTIKEERFTQGLHREHSGGYAPLPVGHKKCRCRIFKRSQIPSIDTGRDEGYRGRDIGPFPPEPVTGRERHSGRQTRPGHPKRHAERPSTPSGCLGIWMGQGDFP